MTDKPENPPAFPRTTVPAGLQDGMTLRDWFAGQAIPALATQDHGNDWGLQGKGHAPAVARKAYAIADAMLAAREQSQ